MLLWRSYIASRCPFLLIFANLVLRVYLILVPPRRLLYCVFCVLQDCLLCGGRSRRHLRTRLRHHLCPVADDSAGRGNYLPLARRDIRIRGGLLLGGRPLGWIDGGIIASRCPREWKGQRAGLVGHARIFLVAVSCLSFSSSSGY